MQETNPGKPVATVEWSTRLRRLNRVAILQLLCDRGPLSRVEIAKILQLNPSTVTRIVHELIEENWVLERGNKGEGSAKGGRRPSLLEFNYRAALIIGLDLGGTKVAGAIVDLEGNILYRQSFSSCLGRDGLESLVNLVQMLATVPCSPGQEIKAIGIGVPGIVRSKEGVVVWAPSLGWRELPLKRILEERVGIPTFVENDVNLRTLGEHWRGAGQGTHNLVCIFIGTGIGAGIIIGGELYRGANEAAGEVGYILPDEKYLGKQYDEFGCLEHLAAGFGIAQRVRAAVQEGKGEAILKLTGGKLEEVSAEHVFTAARNGDLLAQQIVTDVLKYLAIAVANVASILNPEMIVLSGEVVKSGGDLLLERIKKLVQGAVPVMPKIVLSRLGDEAGVLGAAALALRSVEFLTLGDVTRGWAMTSRTQDSRVGSK